MGCPLRSTQSKCRSFWCQHVQKSQLLLLVLLHHQVMTDAFKRDRQAFVQFVFILTWKTTLLCVSTRTNAWIMLALETMSMLYNFSSSWGLKVIHWQRHKFIRPLNIGYNNYDHAGQRITKQIHKKNTRWVLLSCLPFLSYPKQERETKSCQSF